MLVKQWPVDQFTPVQAAAVVQAWHLNQATKQQATSNQTNMPTSLHQPPTNLYPVPPYYQSGQATMVNEDVRSKYSGYLDVDVKGRTFMRRSLNRLSLKSRSVPEQRTMSSISDAASRAIGSTATVLKAGKPLSFSSGNPMFSGGVDGPVERELAVPLARARGPKASRAKTSRGKKGATSKKPLATAFGSLVRQDTRPIVYAVSAWCMVMPAGQAAKEVIKARAGAARVAAEPEPELTTADAIEEGSDGDDTVLAPKLKSKGKKKAAPAPARETRARAGSFRFFRRKNKKGKDKKGDK